MSDADPHIHVDVKLGGAVAARGLLASAFGLAADEPSTVTTGCARTVPLAMTSSRPESVTCLPCREHAHREHLRLAGQIESFTGTLGVGFLPEEAPGLAQAHRALARRYMPGG